MLRNRQHAIVERWCQDALAVYSSRAALVFAREQDQFANPIGHSLRTGTRAVFEALLDGADDERIRRALDDILRTRAIQQLAPSAAVEFLFHLKDVIRQELGSASNEAVCSHDLTEFMRRIDHAVLMAFDVYVAYRERLCELRINEVKRTIPWSVGRRKTG
ncbi:MAG: RsbRD N-terminal domain-containing protein [Gemmatimonadota bacterium]|nr:RsbRD N-terminal domain-containing protein [Gemmatimonadota bacterium]MDH4351424.1 RsbRD N-terminal domain-containing protein [Gemmatimonadota bacterium]